MLHAIRISATYRAVQRYRHPAANKSRFRTSIASKNLRRADGKEAIVRLFVSLFSLGRPYYSVLCYKAKLCFSTKSGVRDQNGTWNFPTHLTLSPERG